MFFNKNLDLVNRDISRPFHAAVAGLLSPRYLVRNVPSMWQTYVFYVFAAIYSRSPLGFSYDSYSIEQGCITTAEPQIKLY